MSRTHHRVVAAASLCTGALALSGCAVIGGTSSSKAVGSDEHLSSSYQLVEPGTLTVCSDIPYPPFEFEQDGKITGYDIELVEAVARSATRSPWARHACHQTTVDVGARSVVAPAEGGVAAIAALADALN